MAASPRARPLGRLAGSFLALLLVLTAGAAVHSVARQPDAKRWKDVQYLGGSLRPATEFEVCDLIVQGDTLVLASPSTKRGSCPVAGTAITGDTIVSIGYARGARPPVPYAYGWDAIYALITIGTGTHVIAVAFRDADGTEQGMSFKIVSKGVGDLLRALSRIGHTPIMARAADIARLPRDLPTTVSEDALSRVLPGVPEWRSRQSPLGKQAGLLKWTPDGKVLFAAGALWHLPSVELLAKVRKGVTWLDTFSADGKTLVTGGASELSLIDVPQGTLRRRVAAPAPIEYLVLAEDGAHAFAISYGAISSIALDGSGVAWTSPIPQETHPWTRLPARPVSGAHTWPGGLVAFETSKWVGVWNGNTGEALLGPGAVLQDLPIEERVVWIRDALVTGTPPRLLLLYSSGPREMLSEVALGSGAPLRTTRLPTPRLLWSSNNHWFSADGKRLVLLSDDGLIVWDTESFTALGTLAEEPGPQGELAVTFDASARHVATSVREPALHRVRTVIWDVSTQRAIGQCLLDAGSTGRLLPDASAVLATRGTDLVICEPASAATARDQ